MKNSSIYTCIEQKGEFLWWLVRSFQCITGNYIWFKIDGAIRLLEPTSLLRHNIKKNLLVHKSSNISKRNHFLQKVQNVMYHLWCLHKGLFKNHIFKLFIDLADLSDTQLCLGSSVEDSIGRAWKCVVPESIPTHSVMDGNLKSQIQECMKLNCNLRRICALKLKNPQWLSRDIFWSSTMWSSARNEIKQLK